MSLSRKDFLRMSALAGGAAVFGIPNKVMPEVKSVRGQVKITNVEPYVFKNATFVRVDTDAGISGWGEGDHDNTALVAQTIDDICKPVLMGGDPFDSEMFWHKMFYDGEDLGFSGLLPGSIAGVDNALWDLKGKILNMPVHKLSGGSGVKKVRMYGSFGRSSKGRYRTPGEMAAEAVKFVEQGYKTIKARMQIRQKNVDPWPDETFEIVKAVRKAIGDEIELFVDFNNGYTPAKAIDMALRLYEHLNVVLIEEPVSLQDYPGIKQVVEALPIPVSCGEHEFNKQQVAELIVETGVNFINADLIKSGGFSECRKSAAIAHAFDRFIMTHNTRPTLATAASLQLIASIPNAARVQEYAGKRLKMGLVQLFDNYFKFEDGYLYVPDSSGLGLTVNVDAMEKGRLNK